MPTYVYRCKKGHTFELFHGINDDTPKKCPECRSGAQRVPAGGAGLLFKGSGFYITDYRSKSYADAAKSDKSASSGESGGGDKPAAAPAEKPAAKPADKPTKRSSGKSGAKD